MARYQQMLLNSAFGNYRQLLENVTLSPLMGQYLDMANNERLGPGRGVPPNENFARQVLQLFPVGLMQINPDGSPVFGAYGRPLPAYGPAKIKEICSRLHRLDLPRTPGCEAAAPQPNISSTPMWARSWAAA